MEPLVSVIIPTYQRPADILARAVRSVLEQTYTNVEIVVIDDNPHNEKTRKSVSDYMNSLNSHNILFLQNSENLGGSLSRNRGIEEAHGEYITFLDDDDEYLPKKIENQLNFMLETDCDLSITNMVMYGSNGQVVDYREHRDIKQFDNGYLLRYHLTRNLSGTPTFMYKAEKLREIGGFEKVKMGQDFFLMLRSIEGGLKIRYLDVCDIKVHRHLDGGISQGRNKIDGEKSLYKFKKSYFPKLSFRERQFLHFRHYAVMVVAYLRNRNLIQALGSAIAAFCSSPSYFFLRYCGSSAVSCIAVSWTSSLFRKKL